MQTISMIQMNTYLLTFFTDLFRFLACLLVSSSSAHLHAHCRHGRGLGQGGGEGPTLQLQGDWDGQQVHHPDVWKHHKCVKPRVVYPN